MYRGYVQDRKDESFRTLHVPQLFFAHAEVMADLVNDGEPHLSPYLGVGVADAFNVLLVQHDMRRPCRSIEDASLRCRNSDEHP